MFEILIAWLMALLGWSGQCVVDQKASKHYPKPEPICVLFK